MTFTKQELAHYNRQLILPEIGISGQQRLRDAQALIVGAGALACSSSIYLAGAGVGTITIIDFDTICSSNLHRQVLYNSRDLGRYKVDVLKDKLGEVNQHIEINAINDKLAEHNVLGYLAQQDIIIDATDNFATRYIINRACVKTNKPFVYGSVYKFDGQVMLFYPNASCYACVFPENRNTPSLNCSEIGVLPTLPGIVGSLQAHKAIKWILDSHNETDNHLIIFNGLNMGFTCIKIIKNPDCLVCNDHKSQSFQLLTTPVDTTLLDLKKFLKNPEVFLIDVRTPEEYEQENYGGVNIPLHNLHESTYLFAKDTCIALLCRSGNRSLQAANKLREAGFINVVNITGGLKTLQSLGYKTNHGAPKLSE